MIHVKVSYTVKPEFVAANQENIRRFLKDFAAMDGNAFRYEVFLLPDGRTFLHLSQYETQAVQQQILKVPSFLDFQQQRDQSGLEGSPQVEILEPVLPR